MKSSNFLVFLTCCFIYLFNNQLLAVTANESYYDLLTLDSNSLLDQIVDDLSSKSAGETFTYDVDANGNLISIDVTSSNNEPLAWKFFGNDWSGKWAAARFIVSLRAKGCPYFIEVTGDGFFIYYDEGC